MWIVRFSLCRLSTTTQGRRGKDVLPKIQTYPPPRFFKSPVEFRSQRSGGGGGGGGQRAHAVQSKHGLACRRCVPLTCPAVGFGLQSLELSKSLLFTANNAYSAEVCAPLPARTHSRARSPVDNQQPEQKKNKKKNDSPYPLHGFESIPHRRRGRKQIGLGRC